MKKLLEECLHMTEAMACEYGGTPFARQFHDMADRLRAALSAYQPDPSPEMMALVAADGFEDERAEVIRLLVGDGWQFRLWKWMADQPLKTWGGILGDIKLTRIDGKPFAEQTIVMSANEARLVERPIEVD